MLPLRCVAVLVRVCALLVAASRLGATGPGTNRSYSPTGQQASGKYGPRHYCGRSVPLRLQFCWRFFEKIRNAKEIRKILVIV